MSMTMIRDTSQQDAVIAPPAGFAIKRRALWIAGAVGLAALCVALCGSELSRGRRR